MSALNARISSLRKDVNPYIRVMTIRGNPKAINTNKTVYVTRTYAISKQAASKVATLSYQDVITAVVPQADAVNYQDVRVSMIKIWNTQIGSSLVATLDGAKVIENSGQPSSQGTDYGTSSSLAGVGFDIPDMQAIDITNQTPLSTNIVTVTTGGASDMVLFHVTARVSI